MNASNWLTKTPSRTSLAAGVVSRNVCSGPTHADPPVLALRPVADGVFTFTGGSGGAAEYALAASRLAAGALL